MTDAIKTLLNDKDGKLSKGNVMCWISFIFLLGLILANLKWYNVSDEAFGTLKYIFTTTFLYSGWKKGADVLKDIEITKNGFSAKKE